MTKRKKRVKKIHDQLSRKLRTISSCNQALLRADDEQTLLNEICHIICEQDDSRMAWVGYIEHDDACSVSPRASSGSEEGYFLCADLTWADTPEGQHPLGMAVRTGETAYAQDLSNEGRYDAWARHAMACGFHSAIALPLKDENTTIFGVLCIYSVKEQAFTPDEIELLEELAADLAFGIITLRLRAERREAEVKLAASEQLFRTLVENSPDYIARYDLDLNRVYINPALQELFNVPVQQLLGKRASATTPLCEPEQYMDCIRNALESASECSEEFSYRTADGEVRWASMRFAPEFGHDGRVESVLVISHDINQRVRAEEEVKAHLLFLQNMDRINRVLQGEGDIEEVMQKVMDEVLNIFACDRAYLVYPCDPNAPTWSVPIESAKPEYPGASKLGQLMVNEGVAWVMQAVLDSNHAIRLGSSTTSPVPKRLLKQFGIRSNMAMALHPRVDKPWQFGVHQCSHERDWSDWEMRLFEEIGHRLSDGLNNLLITRDLRESEERFRLVFENSPVPIQVEDYSAVKLRLDELKKVYGGNLEAYFLEHPEVVRECVELVRIVDVNAAALSLHEADSKEMMLQGLSQIFTAETYDFIRYGLAALANGRTELLYDSTIQSLTGKRRDVSVYLSVCPGYELKMDKVLVSLIDITERMSAENNLRIAASVFANSQEGILISDDDNRIIDVNPAFTRLTGYSREEVLGRNPSFLNAGRQDQRFYADMWQAINTKGRWQGEIWNRRKSGEEYVELLSIVAVRDERDRLQHYVGSFSDISLLKEHEADLDRIAHYDMLTSVPNRRLLSDRMEQAIARTRRHGKSLAVCYLDLDGFKPINDQFGHEGGDRLLVEISRRLQSMSRGDDTVARLGGDEFVLLWNDIEHESECHLALERILSEVSAPMLLDGVPVSVSASIGVTLYPEDDVDADSLLRHADHAMYSAKQLGKNRYQMFDARLERQISSRVEFLEKMARAMDKEQFELYYQPKLDCQSGTITGVEALLRWNDPVLGRIGPREFLPLIEDDSLAFRMGCWVMDQAVRQAREWNDNGMTLPISVNVFPRHLKYQTFVNDLRKTIATCWPQIPKGRLLMEIIESSDLEDLDLIEQVIKECLKMGVGFSLDDFGTGYSSLVYLRRLSVEELKIDQSFVRDMLEDPDDEAIVTGVIGLGHAFGLRVVAEGVESSEQVSHLMDLGCSIVQGFGLGRPMTAPEFQKWYKEFQMNGVKLCH